jgi:L-iditol 2-dehydrogenase
MIEIPIPTAGPGEIVVKVEAALTCGTDLKTFRRGHPKFPFPFKMGHEMSGTVYSVGEGVGDFKVGDAVMSLHSAPCLDCRFCAKGHFNLCVSIVDRMAFGSFADYYKLTKEVVAQNTYHRPDHVSALRGAFMEPLACVVSGQSHVPLSPNDTVVIQGCGTIGLLHLLLAKRRGCRQVVVVGRHQERLNLARKLGADVVIDIDKEPALERVKQLTGGDGAELVIECVGRPQAWEEALWMVAPGGFLLLFHFTPADVRQAYEYLCGDQLPVEEILSGTYSLSQLPEIVAKLDQGIGIKYALIP